MRGHICADWAFGVCGAVENVVRREFPSDLRSFPLLQAFDFEAYQIDEKYLIMVLRDKISGVVAGPGTPSPFLYNDYPSLPLKVKDVEMWQAYLRSKFSLREEDAVLIIPLKDSGKSAPEDYALFTKEEQEVWNYQIHLIVARHKAHIEKPTANIPSMPANITYNVSGTNARVNISSTDNSRNVVKQEMPQIFNDLRQVVEQNIVNENERGQILKTVDGMEQAYGSPGFLKRYQDFMTAAANHVTVLAPLLPLLAGLL